LERIAAIGIEVGRDRDSRAEAYEDAAAERFSRVEVEPDRDHAQGTRPLALVAERQPGGAGLDALDADFRVRRALRIDRDETPFVEGLEARRERARVLLHLVGIVLLPVDGDGAAGQQEAR